MVVRAENALASLYEADETAWLDRMAELVREGRYEDLDYAHLEEYLNDMANRDRREVANRLAVLLEHLLKWTYQKDRRSRSWKKTIVVQRHKLARDVSGGVLRNHAIAVLPKAYVEAVERATIATGLATETFPLACPFTLDQVLTIQLTDE